MQGRKTRRTPLLWASSSRFVPPPSLLGPCHGAQRWWEESCPTAETRSAWSGPVRQAPSATQLTGVQPSKERSRSLHCTVVTPTPPHPIPPVSRPANRTSSFLNEGFPHLARSHRSLPSHITPRSKDSLVKLGFFLPNQKPFKRLN